MPVRRYGRSELAQQAILVRSVVGWKPLRGIHRNIKCDECGAESPVMYAEGHGEPAEQGTFTYKCAEHRPRLEG